MESGGVTKGPSDDEGIARRLFDTSTKKGKK